MSVALDQTPFGSLPASSDTVVKTGVVVTPVTITLGTTSDQSMVLSWLIQATLTETDDQPIALQYWNAASPSIPFSGPGNSGSAQNTRRRTQLVINAKASSPIPVGAFAPPSPDPGFIGLYGVTTWIGKSSVTVDDIHPLPTAPILQFHLPDLTPGFSRIEALTSTRTWQVPTGVSKVRVRLVGGGGGGGGGSTSFGGGGGGGGYAESVLSLQPGQNFAVVVGAGGASSPATVTGGPGGASSFGDLVVAQGGLGGASSNPDSHGGTGGLGTVGMILFSGGMGGDGPMIGSVPAGNGGVSLFGGGGRGSNGGGSPADGKAPGSGAGGGYGTGAAGGFGATGLVLIEY